jgi:hypothetical protein
MGYYQTPINDENNYAITVDFDVYSSGSKLQKVENYWRILLWYKV